MTYKPIIISCIMFMFIEIKFIHCYSCVMFAMKSMMDIMWPISQSHFHVSCLCSLK